MYIGTYAQTPIGLHNMHSVYVCQTAMRQKVQLCQISVRQGEQLWHCGQIEMTCWRLRAGSARLALLHRITCWFRVSRVTRVFHRIPVHFLGTNFSQAFAVSACMSIQFEMFFVFGVNFRLLIFISYFSLRFRFWVSFAFCVFLCF